MGYDANRDTGQSKLETRVLVRKICGRLVELHTPIMSSAREQIRQVTRRNYPEWLACCLQGSF